MKNKTISIVNLVTKVAVIIISVIVINYTNEKDASKVENINLNKTLDLEAMANTVAKLDLEDIYGIDATYTGSLSGYAADCPACSGTLACRSKDGIAMNVLDGTLFYDDETYGKVRIVASSRNLPCGSIINFESERVPNGEIVAIVLDRGVSGTKIDLLSESEEYARTNIGRSTITYNVLRTGWENE